MNHKAGTAVGNQSPDTFLISRLAFSQTCLLRKCKQFSNIELAKSSSLMKQGNIFSKKEA